MMLFNIRQERNKAILEKRQLKIYIKFNKQRSQRAHALSLAYERMITRISAMAFTLD